MYVNPISDSLDSVSVYVDVCVWLKAFYKWRGHFCGFRDIGRVASLFV